MTTTTTTDIVIVIKQSTPAQAALAAIHNYFRLNSGEAIVRFANGSESYPELTEQCTDAFVITDDPDFIPDTAKEVWHIGLNLPEEGSSSYDE